MDIHNYKQRLVRTVANIKESSISEANKKLILGFHDYGFREGLSVCKIERYLYDLFRLAKMLNKDLSEATRADLEKIVTDIEKNVWTPHTKHTFKMMMRKFYRWVEGIDEKGVYPERIKWLRCTIKNNHHKLPEELLSEDDIKLMVNNCANPRDRALIAVLYESGCRIGEIGSIRVKDISPDEYGVRITVSGKTGSRRIRLISSAPYLQEWLNAHPGNRNPSDFVWLRKGGHETLTYTRITVILKEVALRAGIRKRIYPHLFRHSRATYLAKHLTEAQMKDYLGWTQSSKMAAIYVHLSGRDTDLAILKLNGIKTEEEKQDTKLKPKECPRCKTINEFSNRFCKTCGMVIDEHEKEEIMKQDLKRGKMDDLMNDLVKDREFLELMIKKIKEKEGQGQPAHP